jgi:hypothetical protein
MKNCPTADSQQAPHRVFDSLDRDPTDRESVLAALVLSMRQQHDAAQRRAGMSVPCSCWWCAEVKSRGL